MWKLAIVLIVLGYVAAGCGKAPAPRQNTVGVKRPVETYVPVCVVDGVPVYVAAQCANTGGGR